MAASLSGTRAVALSWGLMEGYKPPPAEFVDAAAKLSCQVIEKLAEAGWGSGEEHVDVYSVNVPVSGFFPNDHPPLDRPAVIWWRIILVGQAHSPLA